jgi:hypothetical protein
MSLSVTWKRFRQRLVLSRRGHVDLLFHFVDVNHLSSHSPINHISSSVHSFADFLFANLFYMFHSTTIHSIFTPFLHLVVLFGAWVRRSFWRAPLNPSKQQIRPWHESNTRIFAPRPFVSTPTTRATHAMRFTSFLALLVAQDDLVMIRRVCLQHTKTHIMVAWYAQIELRARFFSVFS